MGKAPRLTAAAYLTVLALLVVVIVSLWMGLMLEYD